MRRVRREHEQPLGPRAAGFAFGESEQAFPVLSAAVSVVDREARKLGEPIVGIGVHRRARDHRAVAFDDVEVRDLPLELLPRTAYQRPGFLQRADQLENASDVVDVGAPDRVVAVGVDHGADAVAGEQLQQQGAIDSPVDDVDAADAVAAGMDCVTQPVRGPVASVLRAVAGGRERLRLIECQLAHQRAPIVDHAGLLGEEDELRGANFGGDRGRNLFGLQTEYLPGGRIAERRSEHDGAVREALPDRLHVDPPDLAGMLVVNAVANAERPRGDEVAGGDPHPGARHRGVGDAHREQRLELDVRRADCFLGCFQGGDVGDANAADGAGRKSLRPHALLDPRPCAVDDDEVDAERAHQREIVDDAVKLRIAGRYTVDLDDERSRPVGIDVGRGVAEPRDEAACVVARNGVAHLGHFLT